MGYGLFLPGFRETFALSTAGAGAIAGLGFLAFLLALPLTAWLGQRVGQRLPVVLGALAASAGFALVASASGTAWLASGIALAGASAGFCWAPFNDAAEAIVPEASRSGALSAVSTGTSAGVVAAAALFLFVASGAVDWRAAWGIFALAAVIAAAMALRTVPGGRAGTGMPDRPRLLRRPALPLYAAAICFGASNAVYLSFAADHLVSQGGLAGLPDRAAPAVIFLAYGSFGLLGLATGRLERVLGLPALLSAIFAAFTASLVLIALAPGAWWALLLSAGLHGAAVMTVSAALAFWSLRLFPGRGTLGMTAGLVAVAASSVAAPALAGAFAEAANLEAAFLVTAAVPLAATLGFAQRARRQRTWSLGPKRKRPRSISGAGAGSSRPAGGGGERDEFPL